MLVSPLSPTTVSGAYGSRQIPLAPYGATVAGLTTGRIAAPLDFDSSMFASDYLARVSLGSDRSEEHTSELQSLMRISYAVFCLKKKKTNNTHPNTTTRTTSY